MITNELNNSKCINNNVANVTLQTRDETFATKSITIICKIILNVSLFEINVVETYILLNINLIKFVFSAQAKIT